MQAASPDGQYFVTGGRKGTMISYPIPAQQPQPKVRGDNSSQVIHLAEAVLRDWCRTAHHAGIYKHAAFCNACLLWHTHLANACAHLNTGHVCLGVESFWTHAFCCISLHLLHFATLQRISSVLYAQVMNEAADKEKLDTDCSSSGRHTETLDCIVSLSFRAKLSLAIMLLWCFL